MTPEEKDDFKKKIEESLEKTKQDVERFKKLAKPVSPDNAIGRITRMDAIQSKSIHEASLRNAENKLRALEIACDKIDTPDFGICTVCGKNIQTGRLLFMPESTVCVTCASR